MKVKICGLSDEAGVAAAVAAGADAIGFVFAPSPRQISPDKARKLCLSVPAGIARVAVTHHPSLDLLREILEVFEPDCLQSDAEDFKDIEVRRGPHLLPVYREGVADPGLFSGNRPEEPAAFVPDFLFEGASSGQGQTVDWPYAARLVCRGRMLLAGGLSADNVGEAMRTVRPWGVDVSSGVEAAPGKKDAAKIAEFVAAVRKEEELMKEEKAL